MRLRLVVLLVTLAGWLLLLAAPASAHAILRATTPVDSETLDAPPATVSLEFNEPVTTSAGGVRVFNAAAQRVDQGDAETPADSVTSLEVGLLPDLPDGTYVVSWRALSADSHPVHGAFVFTVGEATADDAAITKILEGSSDAPMQAAATVLRFLQYLGALLAAGGVFFLVWVHDRDTEERAHLSRLVVRAAIVAAVATVIGVLVQSALVTGLGLGASLRPEALGDVAGSTFGVSNAVVFIGLLVLVAGSRQLVKGRGTSIALVGAVVAIAGFALTGHSATSTPRWLVVSSDVIHNLAGAAWFGGLVLLLAALRRRRAADDPVGGGTMVSRFSTMATIAIVVVSVAGFALGWVEIRALRALTSTAYGWTYLIKVALVGLVLLIGLYNKRKLVPAIRAAGADAWATLRRTVRLEVAGLVLVVGVTAVLVNLIPARDAAGITGPLSVRRPLGDELQVDITVEPNRVGTNEMHVYVFTAGGRPAKFDDVTVGLTMPSEDIGPIEREAERTGPGHWTVYAADFPVAGRWLVTVGAAPTKFEEVSADLPVDVSP